MRRCTRWERLAAPLVGAVLVWMACGQVLSVLAQDGPAQPDAGAATGVAQRVEGRYERLLAGESEPPGAMLPAQANAGLDGVPGISGTVTVSGTPAVGIVLALRRYAAAGEVTVLTTTTDAAGTYRFDPAPSLAAGERYYVRFGPNISDPRYVYVWLGPPIAAYTEGESAAGGDFAIQDIPLRFPVEADIISPLPQTFAWRRSRPLPENYRWHLVVHGPATDAASGWIPNQEGWYILPTLPEGAAYNQEYAWYVEAGSPATGVGYSFALGSVRFTPQSLETLLGEATDAPELTWSTGGTLPWYVQPMTTAVGGSVAHAGPTEPGENSWIKAIKPSTGALVYRCPGAQDLTSSLWHKDWNCARQIRDGLERVYEDEAPYYDWQFWVRQTDLVAGRSDTGWLDGVRFVPSSLPVIVTPNAGTTWHRGYTAGVEWWARVDAGTCFRLDLMRNERSVWEITPCAPNNFTGEWYRFITPGNLPPGNDYRIQVSAASDPGFVSLSEPFTITATPSAPHERVERMGSGQAAGQVGIGSDSTHGFTLEAWIYWPRLWCESGFFWPTPAHLSETAPKITINGALTLTAVYTPTVPEFPDPKHPGMHPRQPAYTCFEVSGTDGTQQPGPSFCWSCEYSRFSGDWHHMALVYDPVKMQWLLYVDGRYQTANRTLPMPVWSADNALVVGGEAAATVEELRISDSARYTQAVVEPPGIFDCDEHTVALYHFDEPTGSAVARNACGSGATLSQQSGATTVDWWPEGAQMGYLPEIRRER